MRVHIKRTLCRLLIILLALLLTFTVRLLDNVYTQSSWTANDLQVMEVEGEHSDVKKQNFFLSFLPTNEDADDFHKMPIINDHKYKFINSPVNICTNKSVDVLVAIHSLIINFDHRRLARHSRRTPPPVGIIYLFFLGKSFQLTSLQQRVDREARQYGDIVQEDFEDSPQNLSLKSVSILKWIQDYCPHVGYVLKKMDDVRLNLLGILHTLHTKEEYYSHFVIGNVKYITEGPVKRELNKYYKSMPEHKRIPFPMYIQGPAYGFPGRTAVILYETSLRTKLFRLEDVYITGMCAYTANIPVFFDNNFIYKYDLLDIRSKENM